MTDYAPLFQPGSRPPADALELYVPAPATLSAALSNLDPANPAHREAIDTVVGIYARSAAPVLQELQRAVNLGADTFAVRLSLAADAHGHVPGLDAARLHLHVYVGPTVENVHTGRAEPLDQAQLGRLADNVYMKHRRWLEETTTKELHVQWGEVAGLGDLWHEITRPDFARLVDLTEDTAASACPGSFGPLARIYADERAHRFNVRRLQRRAS